MKDFANIIMIVLDGFKTKFTLWGITISFWQIFLFNIVISIIAYIVSAMFGGNK